VYVRDIRRDREHLSILPPRILLPSDSRQHASQRNAGIAELGGGPGNLDGSTVGLDGSSGVVSAEFRTLPLPYPIGKRGGAQLTEYDPRPTLLPRQNDAPILERGDQFDFGVYVEM
jgi:hypothetical protein